MNERIKQLTEIDSFVHKIDAEVTLVLQNLQWDRQQILKGPEMVTCMYDKGHLIPAREKAKHEEKCLLKSQGYSTEDQLLPDPPDLSNVVKFDGMEITQIIANAARHDPQFRRGKSLIGPGPQGLQQPLTVDRLQSSFTSDERRAIHDAVVAAAPAQVCRDLELKIESGSDKGTQAADRTKSHAEVLAELRDMKRRRTKYRVVAKTKNYSDALRDVIQTQMELYSDVTTNKTEPAEDIQNHTHTDRTSNNDHYNRSERDRYRDSTPTSHHTQPKYKNKERDRSIARFNDSDKDTQSDRDRSHSHANDTKRDRSIKRELNTYKTDRNRIYSREKDCERKETKHSRSGYKHSESRYDREKSRESDINKRYKEERQERDRSTSKYKDRERHSHSKSKYKKYN